MSGRTWRRRSLGGNDHELLVTDEHGRQRPAGFVSLHDGISHRSVLMDKIVALIAEHHGDIVDDPHTRKGAA